VSTGFDPSSNPPRWLEEAWLRELLLWFVQRLDEPRSRAITRRITERTVPALFDFTEDVDGRWQTIEQELIGTVFTVVFERGLQPYQQPYDNAQLRLRPDSEGTLRHWLNRPRIDPAQAQWLAAIEEYAEHFVDQGQALQRQRLQLPGYSSEQLVAGLAATIETHHGTPVAPGDGGNRLG